MKAKPGGGMGLKWERAVSVKEGSLRELELLQIEKQKGMKNDSKI